MKNNGGSFDKLENMRNAVEKGSLIYNKLRKKARWFTPIGNADNLLRKLKSEKLESSQYYKDYYSAFKKYSYLNRIYFSLRILLYAQL